MSECDYCKEGLPFDAEGWHIRVDPDDWEPTQRIPCAKKMPRGQATYVDPAVGGNPYPPSASGKDKS